ncbi:MAG: TonB-dependent receptor family protein, partial [Lewinella sp.]|nr:TonB-dependent receptor family protein [Lewinella sp.]
DEGLVGSYHLRTGYGRGEKLGGGFDANYRKGPWNVFGEYAYRFNRTAQLFTNYRRTQLPTGGPDREVLTENNREPVEDSHRARLGLDYALSPRTTLGLLGTWTLRDSRLAATSTTTITGAADSIHTPTVTDIQETDYLQRWIGNFNLHHTFGEQHDLNLDLDYAAFRRANPTNAYCHYYDSLDNLVLDEEITVKRETPIRSLVGQLDYQLPLGKPEHTLALGGKLAQSRFDNELSTQRGRQGLLTKDEELSSRYLYDEGIYAAYANLQLTLGDHTRLKAGLRYEWTDVVLGAPQALPIVDQTYGNWFPSLFLSHQLSETRQLQWSYSRRISRPAFTALAPFVIFLDPQTYFAGNPRLQPAYTDAVEVDYRRDAWSFSLRASKETNSLVISQPRIDEENNRQLIVPENFDDVNALSLSVSFPWQPADWWQVQAQATGTWEQSNARYEGERLQLARASLNAYVIQYFYLPHDLTLEVVGFLQTPTVYGLLRTDARGLINLGLRKELPNGLGQLSLLVNDLFFTNNWGGEAFFPSVNLHYRGYYGYSERFVRLTYTHHFGNDKVKATRRRSLGSEEVQRRVE